MPTRTRLRSASYQWPSGLGSAAVVSCPASAVNSAYPFVHESAVDSITWSDSKRPSYNTCHHVVGAYKLSVQRTPLADVSLKKEAGSSAVYLGNNPSFDREFSVSPAGMPVDDISGRSDAEGEAKQQALMALGRILNWDLPPTMNVVRSLVELKDFGKVHQSLVEFIGFLSSLLAMAQGGKKIPFHGSSRVLARFFGRKAVSVATILGFTVYEAAALYLSWKFGLAPTGKDISTFCGQLWGPDLRFQLRKVELKRGQKLRLAFSKQWWIPDLNSHPTNKYNVTIGRALLQSLAHDESLLGALNVTQGDGPQGWPSNRIVKCERVSGVAFATVREDVVVHVGLDDIIRWNSPLASTTWELVPLSFVLDWFLDVGRWLESLERAKPVGAYVNVSLDQGVWSSTRIESVSYAPVPQCSVNVVDMRVDLDLPSVYPLCTFQVCKGWQGWQIIEKAQVYTREPISPASVRPVWSGFVKPFMLGSGAAMLVASSHRLRNLVPHKWYGQYLTRSNPAPVTGLLGGLVPN